MWKYSADSASHMLLSKDMEEKVKFFQERILSWARENLRDFPWRRISDPYVVLITEKMLQQTDFGHVRKVWQEFFKRFPTVQDLALASEEEIASILRPLGLWRQRARQLKALASALLTKYGGNVPCRYEDLISLPGVGDYVARATLLFACGVPTYLLDVNSRKVISRFFLYPKGGSDREIAEILRLVTPRDPVESRIFGWGIIDFSALVCAKKPKCYRCPLNERCSYYLVHTRS
jgi:A/G-specific adenine glycosylase